MSREYYETYWSDGFDPDQALLPSFAQVLDRHVRAEDACLDVGCGKGGGPGAWAFERCGRYIGVDVSGVALDTARAAGLSVELIDDAASLPFPDDTFDVALCIEVLEHLLEPEAAAAETLRVLRPGGRLIATVPNVAHWRRRADLAVLGRWNPLGDDQSARRPWRDPHVRFFGRANLREMLLEVGFARVRTGGHGGSGLQDIPGLRHLARGPKPGPVHRLLVAAAPALFAHRIHAVATKAPAPHTGSPMRAGP